MTTDLRNRPTAICLLLIEAFMRILYDGQVYSFQAAGGINRYFANLISRLPVDCTPTLLVAQVREVNFPAHPNLQIYRYGDRRGGGFSHRLSVYYSQLRDYYLKNVTAFERFDLAHPTYYSLLNARDASSYRCPLVVTVHDMIHELFREHLDPTGAHAEVKRRAIMAADAIICVSENTKKDLLELLPVPAEKISVVYHASDIGAEHSHGPEPVPARPYFLYVGSRSPYKNFDGLLRAFAKAVSSRPELALCVVGPPFEEDEVRLIGDLKLAGHVENYGHASDSHLAKLYRCSRALVYPSLYEGFGLPPLEAMSCGTVAVVANTSSLPEVVGDAGVLFDPRRADELIHTLLLLADDAAAREELIRKGRLRASQFGWDKTVEQTLKVYRSVSASRGREASAAEQRPTKRGDSVSHVVRSSQERD
jgi:glycosyltransferase involved in cell wall biosynthesis